MKNLLKYWKRYPLVITVLTMLSIGMIVFTVKFVIHCLI